MKWLKEKYKRLKKIIRDYDFSLDIENEESYILNYDKEIDVCHKKCNSKFVITLKEFLDRKKIGNKNINMYLEDENDAFCPYCLQNAKNTYYNEKIKDKFNGKYSLESDYINSNEDVTIKHIECGNTITIMAKKILQLKTEPRCKCHSNTLSRAEKMRQYRIQQVIDRYDFSININEDKLFKEYLDKELEVVHKKCNRIYKTKLKEFHKINTGSLSYLFKYVDVKSDLHCPYCLQETKNKYFQEILNEKTNNSYELVGDYNLANSKVTIKHKACGEHMDIWASNIFSSKYKMRCPHCIKLLKSSEKVKQKKFIGLMEEFVFPFDIREPYLFKNNLNNIVEIYHKKCKRTFSIEFGKFNEINIGQIRYLEKYIKSNMEVKCPHCLQEIKNKYFQDTLDEMSKGDFILIGNYLSTKDDVEIKHKSCGKTFKLNAGIIILKKRLSCKLCVNEDNEYQRKIQKDRNESFNKELKEKGFNEFENIGNYINRTTKTTFRHKICGYKFDDTPENFLRRKNKCPNCTGNNRTIFKNQEEKNEVFQNRLNKEVEGFELRGDYLGRNKELKLYHKDCKKEFTTKFDYFIDSKYKCPHCQSNRYRYDRDITIKEKIKYFERDLGNDYKILTGFTTIMDKVDIRHKKCGKTFSKTINQTLKQKGSNICPYCEKERRKEKFLEKLYEKWGNKYKLIGEYVNGDSKTIFEHVSCKHKFEQTPNNMLEKKMEPCPECNDKSMYMSEKFKIKLYKKHKARYSIVSKYTKYDKKVLFKDNICGTTFWETPQNMLKKELPCKKCSTKKRILPFEEVQNRIKTYNGDMYTLAGEYMGTEKELPVMCNRCGHVFEIAPFRLFRVKVCPNCNSRHKK